MNMNIMISINRAYKKYACVMLMSLKEHHENSQITVYILHNELSDADFTEMDEVIGTEGIFLVPVFIPQGTVKEFKIGQWPEVASFRLLVADLFAGSVERILHLDVDILITGSIEELYNMDFEDNYLIACEDFLTSEQKIKKNKENGRPVDMPFFNSGVVLFNVEKMVEEQICYTFFRDVKNNYTNLTIEYPDQDIMNITLGHRVKYVDGIKYNYMPLYYKNNDQEQFFDSRNAIYEHCRIIHMATGNTPWKGIYRIKANEIWWEYAQKTPYYMELKLEHIRNMNFIEKNINNLNQKMLEDICMEKQRKQNVEQIEMLEDTLYRIIDQELLIADEIETLERKSE